MTSLAPSPVTAARPGRMLAVLLSGQVMASMDGSIVSVAAETIRAELRAGGAAVQLVVSGYLLTTGVLLVTCARIGDRIGHRRAFLLGLAWFTVASLLCGLAPGPAALVAARVAQGMGAALLTPQIFSLIQLHWQGAARRRAIGVYSMVLALGVALGQVVGGLVAGADLFGLSWRPVFLINVPVGVAVLLAGRRLLPRTPVDARVRLDPAGVAVLSVAMTALTVPLIFGREQGWPVWTWLSLAGGAALLAAFARHEAGARHPLLDLAALRPAGVKPGLAACWIVMGCYTVFLLTLTLHLQSALGFPPLLAGLAFVPYALGFGTLSLTWNRYPARVRATLPVAGPIAFAAGAGTLVLLFHAAWRPAGAVPLLVLAGAGHAAGYSPLIARITTLVEPRLASAVSALNATGPVLAGVTAVAGLGSVYFAAPTSADGLLRVVAAVTALLAIGTACAARVVRAAGRASARADD
ncbi:MFS transporter [Actinomadura sp. ATCC 31491]|uniref:MFS transporter n=1 Tax=Actinomadura luzonensis TaxID=2805427 RepID=A0ABT0FTV1_9ACTN|nr:MFS transporter [Actinomadura luzonensis]MCK2215764.1 MFS transporter [Actinomadura luzonensis]